MDVTKGKEDGKIRRKWKGGRWGGKGRKGKSWGKGGREPEVGSNTRLSEETPKYNHM